MKKYFLAMVAVILAFTFSAFTSISRTDPDLVWFEVDPDTGEAVNPVDGGVASDTPPLGCGTLNTYFCATALSILDLEVEPNNGGYRIKAGVDIQNPTHYNAISYKP